MSIILKEIDVLWWSGGKYSISIIAIKKIRVHFAEKGIDATEYYNFKE